jgi:two-component system phosphate regulon sensor histidine kinase PhoR
VNDSGPAASGTALPLAARAAICAPLVSHGSAIGALFVFHAQPMHFAGDEVMLPRLLADLAAIAIGNARLLEMTESRQRAANAVFRVAQALAQNLALDDVLQLAVEQITLAVPRAGKAVIHLLRGDVLVPRAASRGRAQGAASLAMRAGSGIAGRALARRTPQVVLDTSDDPDFLDQGTGVRSLIVVPLIIDERVIGTLSVDSEVANVFDADSQQLVVSLGNQATVAIERARLFEAMLAEKRRTEAIVNNMVDGVMLLDGDLRIASVNPALAAMVRAPVQAMAGQLVHDAPYPVNLFGRDLPVDGRDQVIERELHADAPLNKTFKLFASPVHSDADGWAGHVLVVHDVTRERQLDQLKSDFVSTVSHELRTPLFAIRGFVKLLAANKVSDEAQRREFLEIISHQTDHLAQIVNDVLDLSRLDAGRSIDVQMMPVDVADVVHDVVARFRAMADEKHITLRGEVPADLSPVTADGRRLAQALVNLLGNAFKFTGSGGRVTVSAEALPTDEVRFSVEDTGVGIPAMAIPHLFERFYQADQSPIFRAGGTGLGLYITRQIVEAHGGRLGVESTPGVGSHFWFTIPVTARMRGEDGND